MPREKVSFQTSDQVTLRGWFYTPSAAEREKLPCLVMAHGFSAVKEMGLEKFAEYFTSMLPIAALIYDNRGFGESDVKDGSPRQEILPYQQTSDYSDAITYTQSRQDVDPDKIGIWGTSFSGGHVLWVGATDKRVKPVLSQVPIVDGYANFHRLTRPDLIPGVNLALAADRLARAGGQPPKTLPVVDMDPHARPAIPMADGYEFMKQYEGKTQWKNEVTLRSIEALREYYPSAHIHRISPVPLLMTIARNDTLCQTDLALEAYARAREPKRLNLLPCPHFEAYTYGTEIFNMNFTVQAEFLKEHLC